MPIVFPQNSAIGATYDYGGIHYIYNGDGWVNKSIYGVSAGNQISFNNYNGTGPVRIDVVEGIGSGLDADLLQGVSGQRFVENLQTGLLYGGLLQVNPGNSAYFDITSGVGVISAAGASLTAYPVPSFNYVTWGALSGLTVTGITSDEETWVSINSAGNVVQQNTKWTDSQFDDSIPLGVLIHPNNTSINFAVDIPHVAYSQPSQLDPFVRAFGPIKISGHEISANGANLQVNKSTGSAYLIGRNYSTNPNSPNVVEDTNAIPISTIYRYYRNGSGKFTVVTNSSIDPTKWDDGTGVLHSVAGGQYTIQRLFFLPGQPSVLAAYYGRETYNSIDSAQANIPFEEFNEDDSTTSLGVFAGYLIVKGGATQLNNTADAKFINSGIFRNLSNIGGGGVAATSLDDLSDVTITSVATGQVLKYNGGFWENDSVSNLNLVSAAVAGSGINVSGATGSVTITNAGVLSFNGKTGAIQGVSSINGATGAITNVAFTNAAQSFSGLQQFTQGISGSGGVTFYFPSGNTSIRFVSTAARYIEINPGSQNVMQGFGSGGFKFKANAGNLDLKAPLAVVIGDSDLTNNGTQLYVDDDSGVISFVFSGGQYTFPNTDGSANYVMKTDGAGALSWSPAAFTNTAQTFSALQSFSSGISASGGITFNNNIRINSKAILGSAALNSATPGCIEFDGNVIYAGTTSGRGVVDASHIAFASSAVSLSGVTTYQSIFTSAADVVTLAANTSYIVEGHIVIQSGSTTHTTAVRLLDFTGGVAPIFRLHFLTTGAAVGTVSRAQDTVYFETSGGILNSTSTAVRHFILLRGSIETVDSVTITPQVAFSANPGGTNQTQEGSWIKFTPVGTNTMTSVGPWA